MYIQIQHYMHKYEPPLKAKSKQQHNLFLMDFPGKQLYL